MFVIAWPMIGGDWSGTIPDFTTVGHLTAAAIGFTCALAATVFSKRDQPTEVVNA